MVEWGEVLLLSEHGYPNGGSGGGAQRAPGGSPWFGWYWWNTWQSYWRSISLHGKSVVPVVVVPVDRSDGTSLPVHGGPGGNGVQLPSAFRDENHIGDPVLVVTDLVVVEVVGNRGNNSLDWVCTGGGGDGRINDGERIPQLQHWNSKWWRWRWRTMLSNEKGGSGGSGNRISNLNI